MIDKNGIELCVGDNVKIFTYIKAKVVEINQDENNEECAIVDGKKGLWNVYSEEIRKTK